MTTKPQEDAQEEWCFRFGLGATQPKQLVTRKKAEELLMLITEWVKALVTIIAFLFIAGCASVGNERIADEEVLAKIKKGESTKADVNERRSETPKEVGLSEPEDERRAKESGSDPEGDRIRVTPPTPRLIDLRTCTKGKEGRIPRIKAMRVVTMGPHTKAVENQIIGSEDGKNYPLVIIVNSVDHHRAVKGSWFDSGSELFEVKSVDNVPRAGRIVACYSLSSR